MKKNIRENGKLDYWLCIRIGILLVVFYWNYHEIKYNHAVPACNYLQNMGIEKIVEQLKTYSMYENMRFLLHSTYHRVCQASIVNASAFFALFALVIAMLQTVYPFRLGKLYDYPISRIEGTDKNRVKIEDLAVYVFIAIIAEIFGWYLVETAANLIGYSIITLWIHRLAGWYKKYERPEKVLEDCLKEDLEIALYAPVSPADAEELLEMPQTINSPQEEVEELSEKIILKLSQYFFVPDKSKKSTEEAEDEIKDLFLRLIKENDVGEREILTMVMHELSVKKTVSEDILHRGVVKYSYFLGKTIMEELSGSNHPEVSWNYQITRAALFKAMNNAECGMAFVTGLLCGCMTECEKIISERCVFDLLQGVKERAKGDDFFGVAGCLCVWLELYCRYNLGAWDLADTLVESGILNGLGERIQEIEIGKEMSRFYYELIELKVVNQVKEYNLVRRLQQEIAEPGCVLPVTLLGKILASYKA